MSNVMEADRQLPQKSLSVGQDHCS